MQTEKKSSTHLIYLEQFIDPSLPSGLWWCLTAEDVQAVTINAVCKSLLAEWDELNDCREWVERFPYIFVAAPDSGERAEVVEELQKRFASPIYVADPAAFKGNSSVTEVRNNLGPAAVEKLLIGAIELPADGLLDFADIDVTETGPKKRVMSGVKSLDYCLGGFSGGELSVWTGKRGEGKSTWIGQVLIEAVDQGHRVCAYSGELPAKKFKLSMLPQIAGEKYLTKIQDPVTGRDEYFVEKDIQAKIEEWIRYNLHLTDIRKANAHDEDTILRLFEYAYRKYGCDVFLVDNIMTAQLKKERELGYFRAQSAFTQRLSNFAKKNDAHVHLVAHPRKTGQKGVEDADEVGGSGDITNLADNVFAVERVPEAKADQLGYSTRIKIMKNRGNGTLQTIALNFHAPSRRFYEADKGTPWQHYGWEHMDKQKIKDLGNEPTPFGG